jgi:hypothetical protein
MLVVYRETRLAPGADQPDHASPMHVTRAHGAQNNACAID